MSRTYRRLGGDQHWKRWSERNWEWKFPGMTREGAFKKLNALWHADGNRWTMSSTPSAWTREFMTVPQRARTRKLLGDVLGLKDLEDAPLFPLPKKPHHYYW